MRFKASLQAVRASLGGIDLVDGDLGARRNLLMAREGEIENNDDTRE